MIWGSFFSFGLLRLFPSFYVLGQTSGTYDGAALHPVGAQMGQEGERAGTPLHASTKWRRLACVRWGGRVGWRRRRVTLCSSFFVFFSPSF